MVIPENENMTMPEVAAWTRLPLETLRYYRQIGKGPKSFKLGKKVLYARSEVAAWIAAAKAEVA